MEYIDFSNPTVEILEDSGRMKFKATALTPKYVALELIKEYFEELNGKELRWRHKTPEQTPNAFLGKVLSAKFEDDTMTAEALIFNRTKAQKLAQELVKNGDIDAVSVGFIKMTDDKGIPDEIFFRELSLTPNPKCKECNDIEMILNEGEGVIEMSTNPSPPSTPDSQVPVVNKKYIACPHCDGKFMTAEDLNEHWADVYLAQESKIKILTKMEDSSGDKPAELTNLEEVSNQRKNKIMEFQVYTTHLEKSLKTVNERLQEVEEEGKKKDVVIQRFETLPLRFHIAELKGFSENFEEAKKVADGYADYTKEELEEKIEEMEGIHEMYVEEQEEAEDGQIETGQNEKPTIESLEGDDLIEAAGIDPDSI